MASSTPSAPVPGGPHTGPIPSPLPTYVYKIVPEAPPSPLPEGEWPLSQLDKNDGFVHLSTAKQIPVTADLFFTSAPKLWVLQLPYAPFAANLRWELPDNDGCPHLHGVNFAGRDVLDWKEFERGQGTWKEALAGDQGAWLVQ